MRSTYDSFQRVSDNAAPLCDIVITLLWIMGFIDNCTLSVCRRSSLVI